MINPVLLTMLIVSAVLFCSLVISANSQATSGSGTNTTQEATTVPSTTTSQRTTIGQTTNIPPETTTGQSTTASQKSTSTKPPKTTSQSTAAPPETTTGRTPSTPSVTTTGQSSTTSQDSITAKTPKTTTSQLTTAPPTTTTGQSAGTPSETTTRQTTTTRSGTTTGQATTGSPETTTAQSTTPDMTTKVHPETTTNPPNPTPTGPTPNTNRICVQLIDAFNVINEDLPISIDFDKGTAAGIEYPKGKIILKSEARKVNNCVSYEIPGSKADVMAHIEIVENLDIQFPKYQFKSKTRTLTLEIKGNHLVLHYHISSKASAEGQNVLDMRAVLAEVKELGKVTLLSENVALNGTDYTVPAEDVIRPKLLEALDRFAKESLTFTDVIVNDETTQDALDVLKIIFKRKMIQIGNSFS